MQVRAYSGRAGGEGPRAKGRGPRAEGHGIAALGPWPSALGTRPAVLASIAVLALALVDGCGFHLRGSVDIPPALNPLYIEAQPGSLVRDAIAEQLPGGPASLAAGPNDARLILRIMVERRTSRVVATDSTGKVLAYDLRFDVTFDAIAPGGTQKPTAPTPPAQPAAACCDAAAPAAGARHANRPPAPTADPAQAALPPGHVRKLEVQTLDLARTFDNPDVEVLGKQLEEETIYRELAGDAADRILMRLRTALQR
jgi:LPS-assembly lipoprotein